MKPSPTVIWLTVSVAGLVIGAVLFFGGLFAYDWRLGVAGVGFTVGLGALMIDDRQP